MAVTDCPIIGYFNQQRFKQFDPSDCANWYLVPDEIGKKKVAMYPTMGRRHINYLGTNKLIFNNEPRSIYETDNYWYAIVNNTIIRIDQFYNQVEITASLKLSTFNGNIFFTYIDVNSSTVSSGLSITFACFTDGIKFYLYHEETGEFGVVSDPNLPVNPMFLANFGNRIVCSTAGSSTFGLSEINLNYNSNFATMLTNCFTINGEAIFAQERGPITQMGVLQNTLYIFCSYTTGIWANTPSNFTSAGGTTTSFPFKKNTTYDFNFGLADPNSLDIDFGMMAWIARNKNGLIQAMVCVEGGKPEKLSTKAVDVLIQRITNFEGMNPFANLNADGFFYEYEDTVFYRVNAGIYNDSTIIDQNFNQVGLEYNFDSKTWHRVIELNGERNRIQDHVFFANKHLVTVEGDNTVYEMSGRFYTNEITNPLESNPQASDAYNVDPFRYERITPIICAGLVDVLVKSGCAYYDEFITDWLEIDFVWGEETFHFTDSALPNPLPDSILYNNWFKPNIELWFSDDGGISFQNADNLEFSQLGIYQWRMRWNQLGTSRNRVYKLICVSPSPIVVLGANMAVRRASGGAS